MTIDSSDHKNLDIFVIFSFSFGGVTLKNVFNSSGFQFWSSLEQH